MVNAKEQAQTIINDHPVVVFSKSYCPYCKSTKNLLKEKNAKVYILELDEMGSEGAALQDALEEITGQRTVPNVFINHKHIGGNSELQSKKGQLDALLQEAGAV